MTMKNQPPKTKVIKYNSGNSRHEQREEIGSFNK